jgi:energy-coupling factor transporter ATP-binding protein EcfA2
VIHFQHVSFSYPGAVAPALQDVSLHVPASTVALVAGASGSGKSTLLRCTNGLVPHFSGGQLSGSLRVDDLDPVLVSPQGMSRHVGFVFQDPEAQFVVDRVEDEIAFALENLALPRNEMEARVAEALALLELEPLRSRRVETLSGGERQRVAIAAALALRPRLLVLDEPTSQLDPHSAEEVLQALQRLNRTLGLTILLSEHRLERVLPFAGQLIYLEAGRPGAVSGLPRSVLAQIPLRPPLAALGLALGWEPLPLSVEEAQPFIRRYDFSHSATEVATTRPSPRCDEPSLLATEVATTILSHRSNDFSRYPPFLKAEGLEVSYGSIPALRGVSLELYPGKITALLGPNGAGKSTLLRCLVGLLRPQGGRVWVEGQDISGKDTAAICRQVGYLPQDPNALLFADSVREELESTLRFHGEPTGPQVNALLIRLGLADKAEAYPRDLSAGERQRVALGAVMVVQPSALLLDEPTRGLDYAAKRGLLELLRGWRAEGMAILLVTHDVELAALAADQVVLLENGQVTACGSPTQVLVGSTQFAPQIARLFPGSGWLTVEEAVKGLLPGAPAVQQD